MTDIYLDRGEFQLSERFLNKAEKILDTETSMQAGFLKLYRGLLKTSQGFYDGGIDILEKCISFIREYKLDGLSEALTELADVYLEIGKKDDAARSLEESEKNAFSEEFWNPLNQARVYRVKGKLHLKNKDFENAIKTLEKSIQIFSGLDNTLQEALAQMSLSETYAELIQFNAAKKAFDKGRAKFKEIDNDYQLDRFEHLHRRIEGH